MFFKLLFSNPETKVAEYSIGFIKIVINEEPNKTAVNRGAMNFHVNIQ